jgi:hypothetical protein
MALSSLSRVFSTTDEVYVKDHDKKARLTEIRLKFHSPFFDVIVTFYLQYHYPLLEVFSLHIHLPMSLQ